MATYYYRITCSFEWTVMEILIIYNYAVTIYVYINLFRKMSTNQQEHFLSVSRLFKYQRIKVIPFVKISIFKSGNRFMTLQSIEKPRQLKLCYYLSPPIYVCYFFCLFNFHLSITNNRATTQILSIKHGSRMFTNALGKNLIFLRKNQW